MVQNETNLVVADNSGARSVRIFRLYGGGNRKSSTIGDIVLCAVKEAIPNGKVKKGDVVRAIIVRTKKAINRPDGRAGARDSTRSGCPWRARWWCRRDGSGHTRRW